MWGRNVISKEDGYITGRIVSFDAVNTLSYSYSAMTEIYYSPSLDVLQIVR
jgi:hypothetical protein